LLLASPILHSSKTNNLLLVASLLAAPHPNPFRDSLRSSQELSSPYDSSNNGVFVSATGIGFHSQAYPSSTVDFGMSYTAMHWLSRGPDGLVGRPAEMHAANCGTSSDTSCGAAEKAQAALDWNKIITARAAELKKGGRMVIVNFSKVR